MKHVAIHTAPLLAALVLAGCGDGSTAPSPTDVKDAAAIDASDASLDASGDPAEAASDSAESSAPDALQDAAGDSPGSDADASDAPLQVQRVYGVTIDDVSGMADILDSLQKLSHKPTARVVFDEFVPAADYQDPVSQIHAVSFVMGEILDSEFVDQVTVAEYSARTAEYLSALGNDVDVWEVGNEINGEWLGATSDVAAKMTAAFDLVKQQGKRAALTLYYNEDCWSQADHEMFTWTEANVPASMKQGLDQVLVSYYEDDCNGLQPDWATVFQKLATMFPNSQLGMGECGTTDPAKKAEYVHRYYTMKVAQPRYIGGQFWWYFRQDMVPSTLPLWTTLEAAMSES
ncbi:MAG: hypothetical protein HY898_07570 [Deltaproteobacteria bacterium]|nr:hypothetical protein [Deltaproteobacteria bacterium]